MTCSVRIKGDLGFIGHYEANSLEVGVEALLEAKEKLRELGAKRIVGPINENTWHRYRLALDDYEPFFLGEPSNPKEYHDHFLQAGFTVLERYESRIVRNLSLREEAYLKGDKRLHARGIEIRPFTMDELPKIHEMSLPAFRENPFYEPIALQDFIAMYEKLAKILDPDLVPLAFHEERLIGYALAYPDGQRLIFKTLTVDKKYRALGLGVYLFDRIHYLAAKRGQMAVIHALMHEKNNSLKLSKRMDSEPFRSYALYTSY
jgi:GNAT superfamily N-acetyltransferase